METHCQPCQARPSPVRTLPYLLTRGRHRSFVARSRNKEGMTWSLVRHKTVGEVRRSVRHCIAALYRCAFPRTFNPSNATVPANRGAAGRA